MELETRRNTYTMSEREEDHIYCNTQFKPKKKNTDETSRKQFSILFIFLVFFCLVQVACIIFLFIQHFELQQQKVDLLQMIKNQSRILGERIENQSRTLGERIENQSRTLGERVENQEMKLDFISRKPAIKLSSSFLTKTQEAFENISSIIPSFYSYRYNCRSNSQNSILDGGNDMYDRGNKVKIYQGSNVPVNAFEYGSRKSVWNYNYAITPPHSHPFISLVWISNPKKIKQQYKIQVTGNLGADGSGIISLVDDGYLNTSSGQIYFRVFQVYNTDDPSVCEVYFAILKEEWDSSGFQSMSLSHGNSTNNVNNTATISGQPHNILFGYTLLSRYFRLIGLKVSKDSIELFLKKLGDSV